MSAVTEQEIVSLIEGLIESDACMGSISDKQVVTALEVVSRIKANGIAPPDCVTQADEETHRRVDEAVRNGRIEDRRAGGEAVINYPPYMRDKFTKKLFRLGVIHRVLLENENPTHRIKLHAFNIGRHLGALEMLKSTWWRSKSIGDYMHEEAKRICEEINEVKT